LFDPSILERCRLSFLPQKEKTAVRSSEKNDVQSQENSGVRIIEKSDVQTSEKSPVRTPVKTPYHPHPRAQEYCQKNIHSDVALMVDAVGTVLTGYPYSSYVQTDGNGIDIAQSKMHRFIFERRRRDKSPGNSDAKNVQSFRISDAKNVW